MILFRAFFILGLLICVPGIGIAEKLKVATSTWPPYSGKDLPQQGVAIEIVRTALSHAGYDTQIIIESWPRTLQGVNVQVYDVIATVWYSDERARTFTFSKPYLYNQIKFIKRKDSAFTYNGLDDLNKQLVGVVKDYAYGDEFNQAPGVIKIAANHIIQNLLRLSQGQIDVTLGDERALRYEINSYLQNSKDQFIILPKPLSVKGLHIAVSKQHPKHKEIAVAFDKAIEKMHAEGAIADIVKRHKDGHQWLKN